MTTYWQVIQGEKMKGAVLLVAAASLQGMEAFAPTAVSTPGLRSRSGVCALAMSGQDKCEQVSHVVTRLHRMRALCYSVGLALATCA